jgi:hypothetical protein
VRLVVRLIVRLVVRLVVYLLPVYVYLISSRKATNSHYLYTVYCLVGGPTLIGRKPARTGGISGLI